jgi:hypothetical protein
VEEWAASLIHARGSKEWCFKPRYQARFAPRIPRLAVSERSESKVCLALSRGPGDENGQTERGAAFAIGGSMFVRVKFFFALGLLLWPAVVVSAQESPAIEYRLKAAFLWNFAKFVDWPTNAFANDKAPFVIGVLGDNPFGADLEQTVKGKLINDHPITVKSYRNATDARASHILFVSSSEESKLPDIIESLRGAPVLTVGEYEQFTQSGGMINFVREANKIRFQINDEAAKAAGLKISSKLLSLAVRTPPR